MFVKEEKKRNGGMELQLAAKVIFWSYGETKFFPLWATKAKNMKRKRRKKLQIAQNANWFFGAWDGLFCCFFCSPMNKVLFSPFIFMFFSLVFSLCCRFLLLVVALIELLLVLVVTLDQNLFFFFSFLLFFLEVLNWNFFYIFFYILGYASLRVGLFELSSFIFLGAFLTNLRAFFSTE